MAAAKATFVNCIFFILLAGFILELYSVHKKNVYIKSMSSDMAVSTDMPTISGRSAEIGNSTFTLSIDVNDTPKTNSVSMLNSSSPTQTNQTKLLIIGYKKGGSSITGALIQSHPSVYYIYEPLHYLRDPDLIGISLTDTKVSMRVRTQETYSPNTKIPDPLEHLARIFNCGIEENTWKFTFGSYGSRYLINLTACLAKKQIENSKCFKSSSMLCSKQKVVSIKSVRIQMREIHKMMSTDPSIKVILLFRDPRAVYNSRIATFLDEHYVHRFPKDSIPPLPKPERFPMQCKIMSDNFNYALSNLSADVKSRVGILRYEDLVESPKHVMSQIFQFINLTPTPATDKAILTYMENFGKKNKPIDRICPKCVKDNSNNSATVWRKQITFTNADLIQNRCNEIIELMGYVKLNSEKEIRDISYNSRIPLENIKLEGFRTFLP